MLERVIVISNYGPIHLAAGVYGLNDHFAWHAIQQ
jgi:hypothetical protein